MTGSNSVQQVSAAGEARGAGVREGAPLPDDLPKTVRFGLEPARYFIAEAAQEYQRCLDSRDTDGVPSHLPRVSGLLFGRSDGAEITISAIEFAPNVRDRDESVMAEFEDVIAPQFGDVYRNPGRGFWCDEKSVLQAVKRHSADGMDLMGSIHSHPNWHEIGPLKERRQELSENPTRMDEYLFRQSCWPVNVIWYVRAIGDVLAHRVAGWRLGSRRCDRLDVQIPPAILDEFDVTVPKEA